MAKFLAQTVNGQVKHDFVFGLIEAVEYQNWYNAGTHELDLCDNVLDSDYEGYIPVGTIQFVQKFLSVYHNVDKIRPINIPVELSHRSFVKRYIEYTNKQELHFGGESLFVKSIDALKGFAEIVNDLSRVPDVNLMTSEVIDIQSEWRAFVFRGKLVGLQNYSGDFVNFPDIEFINNCIGSYQNCPPSYTLDVGVNETNGTFVIEVHNFYSCGLYGFSENKILPQMFASSFVHLVQKGW
jgi:hypothetical protein